MNKWLSLIIVTILVGCSSQDENAAIQIGNIKVSAQEYAISLDKVPMYMRLQKSDKEILENFITRKLILREAMTNGLDRDPDFIADVQMFWEQALMKIMLEHYSQKLSDSIVITDDEVRVYYDKYRVEAFANQSLEEVKSQILPILHQQKIHEAMLTWTEELRNQTPISIDYQALGIQP